MADERILIVDDNPVNSRLARMVLEKAEFHVRTAEDAETALIAMEEFAPQLVLMDIQLPGMDGLEATRIIKSNPRFEGVLVLALTAYAMKGDEDKALDAGCDGYISKPINTRTLPGLLRQRIRERGNDAPGAPGAVEGRNEAIVDIEALRDRCDGDAEMMSEIIELFTGRYAELLADARRAAASNGGPALERAAHSLRGYLLNFGAKPACRAALDVELLARSGDLTGVEPLLAALADEVAAVLPVLSSLVRSSPASAL